MSNLKTLAERIVDSARTGRFDPDELSNLDNVTAFGASGAVSGLGSAFVAELFLTTGTSSGTYAPLELELNIPSGASTGTATSFIYMSANDTPAAFDTAGFLFNLAGLTADTGKLFDTLTPVDVQASARLRVKVGETTYYIPLCALEGLNDS